MTKQPEALEVEELNIYQRLARAQGEVDYIQKEKKAGMNYTIVSHDAVTAKVRPVLHKWGVLYYPVALTHTQNGNRTEVALTVRFQNVDQPTDFIDVPSLGYGVDAQDKGPGKGISYAVKYALLKVLGLETGDDPDTVQDSAADHEGLVFKALKTTIDMMTLADTGEVGKQIAAKANDLSDAELTKLRKHYSAVKKQLTEAAPKD